jgi:hypothetical protein
MKKTIIAIAAATLLMPIQGHAKELSDAAWHKKFDNCEMTDRRGPNHDGDEFCMNRLKSPLSTVTCWRTMPLAIKIACERAKTQNASADGTANLARKIVSHGAMPSSPRAAT